MSDVPKLPALAVGSVMHLFRCLQKVFANVLTHAQAGWVPVRTWLEEGRLGLSVADDGVGLGSGGARCALGLGLGHLRARAQALGAELRFSDKQPGTRPIWSTRSKNLPEGLRAARPVNGNFDLHSGTRAGRPKAFPRQ